MINKKTVESNAILVYNSLDLNNGNSKERK